MLVANLLGAALLFVGPPDPSTHDLGPLALVVAAARERLSPEAKSLVATAEAGFGVDPRLDALRELMIRKEWDAALAEASRLSAELAALEATNRDARRTLARVQHFLADVHLERHAHPARLKALEEAARRGDVEAAYELGALEIVEAAEASTQESKLSHRQAFLAWISAAAELGHPAAEDSLAHDLDLRGQRLDSSYWFFLSKMHAADPDATEQALVNMGAIFDAGDWSEVQQGFDRNALSAARGGQAGVLGARSLRTVGLVDQILRRQLEFSWRVGLNEHRPTHPLRAVYDAYRLVTVALPWADTYLVAVTEDPPSPGWLSVTRGSLRTAILPGDEVYVRGAQAHGHYCTFWGFSPDGRSALLVDPFFEWWQPAHNAGVTSLDFVAMPLDHRLVKLDSEEFLSEVQAFFAIRDRAPPPPTAPAARPGSPRE